MMVIQIINMYYGYDLKKKLRIIRKSPHQVEWEALAGWQDSNLRPPGPKPHYRAVLHPEYSTITPNC